ncbi:Drug resistance protein [Fusarium oxysporum f. sp. albedinis]|nr:Drug resistance protein [Fusarium oxysporum f. sp. albedinis]
MDVDVNSALDTPKSSSKTTQVPGEYLKYLLINQPALHSLLALPCIALFSLNCHSFCHKYPLLPFLA